METKKILLIDDSPISRRRSRHWLERAGYTVVEAEDGTSSLSMVRASCPSLIVQDLVLPDMEGRHLLTSLKRILPTTPVLAFSAVSNLSEQAAWLSAGFDGFIQKPGTEDYFLREIAIHLAPPSATSLLGSGLYMLFAGSSQTENKLRRLENRVFEVEQTQELCHIFRLTQSRNPDIFVSELNLVNSDGLEFYRAIRSVPAFDNVPFVFLTEFELEPRMHQEILSLGIDAVHSQSKMGTFVKTAQPLCRGESRQQTHKPSLDNLNTLRLRLSVCMTNHLNAKVQALTYAKDFSEAKVAAMRRITDSLSLPSANPDEKIGNIFSTCLDACSVAKGALLTLESDVGLDIRIANGLSISYLELHREILARHVDACIKNDTIECLNLAPQTGFDHQTAGMLVPLNASAPMRGAIFLVLDEKIELSSEILTFYRSVAGMFSQALSLKAAMSRAALFEKHVTALMENANDAIGILDEKGFIVDGNQRWADFTGVSRVEANGHHFSEFGDMQESSSHIATFESMLAVGHAQQNGVKLTHAITGRSTIVDLSLSLLKTDTQNLVLVIARDVTERMELEQRLRHSQKLDAVGQLAGGIAHDFNNLVTVILANCLFLRASLGNEDARQDDVNSIRSAAERAANLTRQLLAFSSNQSLNPKTIDLNEIVVTMEPMIRRVLVENIDLHLDLDNSLQKVRADAGQIEQVLLNLVINARDAMPNGGTISLRTRNVDSSRRSVRRFDRPHTCFEVQDTGSGMNAVTLNRIFEPFFTTKDPSKGTGLGLSTVYGIVKQSGGEVHVESTPDEGSTFYIYLPVDESAATQDVLSAPESGLKLERLRKGKVLIIEDEAMLRTALARLLRESGYVVLEGESGEACLRTLSHEGHGVDVVLTDVVMPGMSGYDLGRRIMLLHPKIRYLFMTGYVNGESKNPEFEKLTIQKPMEANDLLKRIDVLFHAA